MSEQKTLLQMNAWHDAYVDQLVKRGLDRLFAEQTLDAGMGTYDYDDDPAEAADEELSVWSE